MDDEFGMQILLVLFLIVFTPCLAGGIGYMTYGICTSYWKMEASRALVVSLLAGWGFIKPFGLLVSK